ncbi:MAG: hypothetical protein ACE5NW_01645 [Acidiferrobacterales bacterium]
MAPIFDEIDHLWTDGDPFGNDVIPDVLDIWPPEDVPEPPEAWTLQDLTDLLPDGLIED